MVIDLNNDLEFDSNCAPIIIVSLKENNTHNKNITYIIIYNINNLWNELFFKLHKMSINSVIIEGGIITLQSVIDNNIWDEIHVFERHQSENEWTEGRKSPIFKGELLHKITLKDNDYFIYKHKENSNNYLSLAAKH